MFQILVTKFCSCYFSIYTFDQFTFSFIPSFRFFLPSIANFIHPRMMMVNEGRKERKEIEVIASIRFLLLVLGRWDEERRWRKCGNSREQKIDRRRKVDIFPSNTIFLFMLFPISCLTQSNSRNWENFLFSFFFSPLQRSGRTKRTPPRFDAITSVRVFIFSFLHQMWREKVTRRGRNIEGLVNDVWGYQSLWFGRENVKRREIDMVWM